MNRTLNLFLFMALLLGYIIGSTDQPPKSSDYKPTQDCPGVSDRNVKC